GGAGGGEQVGTPVFLRTSTRVAHSQSMVEEHERVEKERKPYQKNVAKYVMMPAMARPRHKIVEERTLKLAEYAAESGLNKVIPGDRKIGVIAAGIAYQYAREALGDKATYLKLGMVYPLSARQIREFAASVDKVYVVEELDPFIEDFCKANGVACVGKSLFTLCGEYTPAMIKKAVLGEEDEVSSPAQIPVRPPVLCPGCPHRGIFYVLSKMKLVVSGDIGCYTLGAQAPLAAVDSTIDMGESVSGLHGLITADPSLAKRAVACIGDSTFVHSGITGLINAVYNRSNVTVLILDNSITGMTGHQQNPCTGLTLQNQPTHALDLEALCRAIGVKRVNKVDPYDITACEALLKEELAAEEPSVIIVKRPCALLKSVKRLPALSVDPDACRKCRKCMSIGCPAVLFDKAKGARIDNTLCVGCGLCQKLCAFDAIKGGNK
ncbi:MAG: thiamine pyrophosphate-dependent enzyme, partial [Clostridia bacterium]|nr:thiamine pyrophosphate-dependent enzyme [Clostridia bacterium]